MSLNWLLSEEPFQSDEEMAMGFLDFLLIGTQASPMYKALTDSGLGESVAGLGIEDDLNQPFLGIGLKGVKEADAEKVTNCIYVSDVLFVLWSRKYANTHRWSQ